jgi:branched-chain amino acid transport system ATP-binding protein
MTALLAIEGLHAGYGSTAVLHGVSIEVGPGEVVAILGRNGAGKTTTLMTVSGLVTASAGTIAVDGVRVRSGRPTDAPRLGVGHVPEARSLFTQLSVRDNLVVAAGRRGNNIRTVYGLFPELEVLAGRRAGLLSGGEQQMLALARAIVQRPRLLMVDEMSLGLAPIICERLGAALRRLADDEGVGVLLVEQHLHLAMAVADRGYVMRRGVISFDGSRQELVDRSDEVRTAYLPTVDTLSSP